MIEPQRVKITSYRPKSPRNAVALEKWLNRETAVPLFSHGSDFLDWLVDTEVVFGQDLTPLYNLPELLPILAQWGGRMCFPGVELQNSGWLRWGRYQLYLSSAARCLTVRRGNQYGRFIDLGGLAPDGWPAIVRALKQAGIYRLPYPRSAGGVAGGLLDRLAPITTSNLPAEVLGLSWQACKGGRMEALTIGTFDGYASDLSSAYPAAAKALPRCDHPRLCEWRESTEYQPSAFYGVALIDVDLPDWKAGPLAVRVSRTGPDDDLELHFPTGRLRRVAVAMPDMRLLESLGIPFTVKKGWWGFITASSYPFWRLMNLLWDLRSVDRDFAKTVSVACVGQLGSVDDAAGIWDDDYRLEARPYFAPVYFSHIYAEVRAQIYRKAMEAGLEHVHAFSIDGVITDRAVPQEVPGMGRWREESRGRYFLAGDALKDRPGDSGRWRSAVESTPSWMSHDSFEAAIDTYVSLPLLWQQPRLKDNLGGVIERREQLPLGAAHRQQPAGVTRVDYLEGAIPTWLNEIHR